MFGALLIFVMGGFTGLAIETNNEKVSDFGDKYLSESAYIEEDVDYSKVKTSKPAADK